MIHFRWIFHLAGDVTNGNAWLWAWWSTRLDCINIVGYIVIQHHLLPLDIDVWASISPMPTIEKINHWQLISHKRTIFFKTTSLTINDFTVLQESDFWSTILNRHHQSWAASLTTYQPVVAVSRHFLQSCLAEPSSHHPLFTHWSSWFLDYQLLSTINYFKSLQTIDNLLDCCDYLYPLFTSII